MSSTIASNAHRANTTNAHRANTTNATCAAARDVGARIAARSTMTERGAVDTLRLLEGLP